MNLGLLYLCAFTGLIIVIGSFLLIWKGRILIDSQSGAVSEVELPLGFRLKTQTPVVVMFFFGAFLLTLPIILIRKSFEEVESVQLVGKIGANPHPPGSYKAYAMAAGCDASNEVRLVVPFVKNTNYKVLYYDNTRLVFDEFIDWSKVKNGKYELKDFQPPSGTEPAPAVLSKEADSIVSTFK